MWLNPATIERNFWSGKWTFRGLWEIFCDFIITIFLSKFVQVVEFVGQQNAAILVENMFENPGRSTCYRFEDNLVFPGIP